MIKKKINYSWRLKTRKMTYILAGKLNNNPFIMVDKVVNFNPNEPTQTKIYQSVSNPNIIISLTGNGALMDIIKAHDNDLHQQGQVLTANKDLMNHFACELEMDYDRNDLVDNYIYVIDGNDLIRYDLKFPDEKTSEYDNCTSIIINEGEFLSMANREIEKFDERVKNAKGFSEYWLKRIYTDRFNSNDEKHDINEYFREGFNFFTVEK